MLITLRNMLIVAFVVGLIISSKITLAYSLGSAVGFSLMSTFIAVVLFSIPAGIYWIFTQKKLNNAGAWLWTIWFVIALAFIGTIVKERISSNTIIAVDQS